MKYLGAMLYDKLDFFEIEVEMAMKLIIFSNIGI